MGKEKQVPAPRQPSGSDRQRYSAGQVSRKSASPLSSRGTNNNNNNNNLSSPSSPSDPAYEVPRILMNKINGQSAERCCGTSIYKRNWIRVILGTTSGMMFVLVASVGCALYKLGYPRADSITFGILLSVVFHPGNITDSSLLNEQCVKQMRSGYQKWSKGSAHYSLMGSVLLLRPFFSTALTQGVLLFGLDKIPSPFTAPITKKSINDVDKGNGEAPPLLATSTGEFILKTAMVCITLFVAHMMLGVIFFVGMHIVLFIIFASAVMVMEEEKFVRGMSRLWRFSLIFFFATAFMYNLALDILSISDAVKRTTTAVVNAQKEWSSSEINNNEINKSIISVNNTNRSQLVVSNITNSTSGSFQLQQFVFSKVQETVLKELSVIFDQTNATDFAATMQEAVTPLLANLSDDMSELFSIKKIKEIYDQQFSKMAAPIDWVNIGQKVMERWMPFVDIGTQAIVSLSSNMMNLFDSFDAFVWLFVVFRYFTQLERTVLYYILAKMLKILHPQFGERHARCIEQEITSSFSSLLLSFWQMVWYHFCITFCLFKMWSFTTPLLCGIVASLIGAFPVFPKVMSPVAFAFAFTVYTIFEKYGVMGIAGSSCFWSCLLAFILSNNDEWLLFVSRDLSDATRHSGTGGKKKKEQISTFIVGTSLFFGYIQYGMRGILIGPITVIVAKVLFDNWDSIFEEEEETMQRLNSQQADFTEKINNINNINTLPEKKNVVK